LNDDEDDEDVEANILLGVLRSKQQENLLISAFPFKQRTHRTKYITTTWIHQYTY
jgi:hypothetical protein